MARSSPLPAGVKAIAWKNGIDGTTSTRYRVRLMRTAEKFRLDRLCDTLDDAAALIDEARTPEGRARIAAGRDCLTLRAKKKEIHRHIHAAADADMRTAATQATAREMALNATATPASAADAMRDAITRAVVKDMLMTAANGRLTTLGEIVERYIKKHLAAMIDPENIRTVRENARTRAKLMKLRLVNAMATPLLYMPAAKIPENPLVGAIAKAYESKNGIVKPLGDWLMIELDAVVGKAYIRRRMAEYQDKKGVTRTRSASTVKREIVDIVKVINDLDESDPGMWAVIGGSNKFAECTRLLSAKAKRQNKTDGTKRWRRVLVEEEAKLVAALTTATVTQRRSADEIERKIKKIVQRPRNPELLQIFRLSLATGMRLSECVLLEWQFIDIPGNTIYLSAEATKNGARRPIITPEAHAVLAKIPRKDGRLFHYTVQGFKSTWRKIRAASGVKDLVWHDLRRTAISRDMENLPGVGAVEMAQRHGYTDVKHFDENMRAPILDAKAHERGWLGTERQLRQHHGHASAQMSMHYADLQRSQEAREKARGTAKPVTPDDDDPPLFIDLVEPRKPSRAE